MDPEDVLSSRVIETAIYGGIYTKMMAYIGVVQHIELVEDEPTKVTIVVKKS